MADVMLIIRCWWFELHVQNLVEPEITLVAKWFLRHLTHTFWGSKLHTENIIFNIVQPKLFRIIQYIEIHN